MFQRSDVIALGDVTFDNLAFDGQEHPLTPDDTPALATLLKTLSDGREVIVLHRSGADHAAHGWRIPSLNVFVWTNGEIYVSGEDPHVVENQPGDRVFYNSTGFGSENGSTYCVAPDRSRLALTGCYQSVEFYFLHPVADPDPESTA